jgi:hypothetical protein
MTDSNGNELKTPPDWEKQQKNFFRELCFTVEMEVLGVPEDKIKERIAMGNLPETLAEKLIKAGHFEIYNQSTGHVLYSPKQNKEEL